MDAALPLPLIGTVLNSPTVRDEEKYFNKTHKYLYENKEKINSYVHIAAATANALTFLNGNFNFVDIGEELQETISNFFSRFGTATRGITGAVDCLMKKNLIPLIGSILEVPIAFFAKGDDLWLMRGIAQSIRQVQGVIKRRGMGVTLSNGNKITLSTEDGDNFSKYGISTMEGLTSSLKEYGKIIGEYFTCPLKKEKIFSRANSFCSFFQGGGPILYMLGFEKFGPFFRDLAGALIDGAYIMDERKANEPSYVPAGTLWIGSAICDYLKRFEGISSSVKNLTQLSLLFDMVAAIFESRANFGNK